MKKLLRFLSVQILILIMFCTFLQMSVFAKTTTEYKYYLGEAVNAGKDTGYSESNSIVEGDPHFGWKIGSFFVSGYSAVEKDENGDSVFLKNVGDKVTLWFCLEQDIDKLNGKENYSISTDIDGYDEYFQIERTNFGRGTLIVRQKNHENQWGEPVIYTDFLKANTSQDAYTQVELFEEGDYEVALNYEIKENGFNLFGWEPLPNFNNYRIFFRFSVRNGNCMVYPFDVKTGAELTNSAFTENGFYIDLANSKYLDINIKKMVLNEGSDGLVEDVRFNRPAKDGEQYTEEGVYTITASNAYTKQKTVKKIYVGSNAVLKAHVTTGFNIDEINHQISLGATIGKEGELIPAPNSQNTETKQNNNDGFNQNILYSIIICVSFLIITAFTVVFVVYKKKKKASVNREGGNEE